MNSPAHGHDRLSGLAAAIAGLDSVTIYGRVDASVGSIDKLVGSSQTKLFSGGDVGLTTPRLGFRGVEALGGGLKATFSKTDHVGLDFLDIGIVTFGGRLRY